MYELLRRAQRAALDGLAPARCAGCGDVGAALCATCVNALEAIPQPLIAGARAAFAYEAEVRRILHHGKFRDCRAALRALAWVAAARLAPPPGSTVVPVPLGRRRLRERGYNQAGVVAHALADFHRLPVAELLTRTRETPAQSTLDRGARQQGVAGAFSATADATGLRAWLVDDVLTTGATSRAARRALLDAGAARVDVAVLAAVL